MFFFHFLYAVTLQKSSVFLMVHILPWKQNEWFYFSNQWEHHQFFHYYQNFLGLRVSLFLRQNMSSFKHGSESFYFVWLGGTESLWFYFPWSPSTGPSPPESSRRGDPPQMCRQSWGSAAWLKGVLRSRWRWRCGRGRGRRRGGALCPSLTPVTTPS